MISVKGKMYDGVAIKPTLDEAFEHYGVKGMKWRKRKHPRREAMEKRKSKNAAKDLGVNSIKKESNLRSGMAAGTHGGALRMDKHGLVNLEYGRLHKKKIRETTHQHGHETYRNVYDSGKDPKVQQKKKKKELKKNLWK